MKLSKKNESNNNKSNNKVRGFYYKRNLIVIPILVIIIGGFMCYIGWRIDSNKIPETLIEIFKTFGVELIVGSAIVLFNYLIFGPEVQNKDISDESFNKIISMVDQNNKKIINSVDSVRELSPSHTFKACDTPDVEFNLIVNSKLKSAAEYTYFGDSSSFFVARLKSLGGDPQKKINVFIPDYTVPELFTAHKLEIRKRYVAQVKDTDEAIIMARMRILQNMYALMKLSKEYSISIYLHKEIPFLRFEVAKPKNDSLDKKNFMVLSFLPIDVNQKRFPPSFIYDNDTYLATFNGYIDELKERAELINEKSLNSFNFVKAAKFINPNLQGSDQKIIDEHFEKYYNNMQKVEIK